MKYRKDKGFEIEIIIGLCFCGFGCARNLKKHLLWK